MLIMDGYERSEIKLNSATYVRGVGLAVVLTAGAYVQVDVRATASVDWDRRSALVVLGVTTTGESGRPRHGSAEQREKKK